MRIARIAALIGIATLGVPAAADAMLSLLGSPAGRIVPGVAFACASLDKDTVRRVFRRHQAQIKYCYERQLEKDRRLHGRLVLKLTIDGNGRVSAAEIGESELANEALHACITDAARKWEFPVVGDHEVYTIAYPYAFEPAAPPPAQKKP